MSSFSISRVHLSHRSSNSNIICFFMLRFFFAVSFLFVFISWCSSGAIILAMVQSCLNNYCVAVLCLLCLTRIWLLGRADMLLWWCCCVFRIIFFWLMAVCCCCHGCCCLFVCLVGVIVIFICCFSCFRFSSRLFAAMNVQVAHVVCFGPVWVLVLLVVCCLTRFACFVLAWSWGVVSDLMLVEFVQVCVLLMRAQC